MRLKNCNETPFSFPLFNKNISLGPVKISIALVTSNTRNRSKQAEACVNIDLLYISGGRENFNRQFAHTYRTRNRSPYYYYLARNKNEWSSIVRQLPRGRSLSGISRYLRCAPSPPGINWNHATPDVSRRWDLRPFGVRPNYRSGPQTVFSDRVVVLCRMARRKSLMRQYSGWMWSFFCKKKVNVIGI